MISREKQVRKQAGAGGLGVASSRGGNWGAEDGSEASTQLKPLGCQEEGGPNFRDTGSFQVPKGKRRQRSQVQKLLAREVSSF